MMGRPTRILMVCLAVLGASVAGTGVASASPPGTTTCSGSWQGGPGMLTSGTYRDVTVMGVCVVPAGADVTVRGDVRVQAGAQLVSASSPTVLVQGDVRVGRGAVLLLGCTAEIGCDPSGGRPIVRGDVVARNALSIYLLGDTIRGDVSFIGGGWGANCTDPNADDPNDPLGHSLAIKDNTVTGDVTVQGWTGCWMGLLRNVVRGDVRVMNNYANQDPANVQGPDSTEIVANRISGSLRCRGNTPAAQLGDALVGAPPGYGPNTVRGKASGECVALTQ